MGAPMRYQPQGRVRLNTGHPLARALTFAWVASAPDVNLVTGKPATTRGATPAKALYIDRVGRKFVGAGSIDFGNTPETNFGGLSQQTVLAEVFMDSTANGFILGRVQSTWDYFFNVSSGPQQILYGAGGDSSGVAAPAASVPSGLASFQGRPVPVVGTYDKINAKIYIDGALKNTKANTGSFSTSTDQFAVGARGGGGQSSVTGIYVGLVLIFKRVLSDVEVLSVSQNPWQLFDAGSNSSAYQSAIAAPSSAPGVSISGAWLEQSDQLTLAGAAKVTALPAWSEASDVAAMAALVGSAVSASGAWSEASDALSIAASARVTATGAFQETPDTLSLAGAVGNAPVATIVIAEQSDSVSALATVKVSTAAGWAEASDLAGFSATVLASAGIAWSEVADGTAVVAAVDSGASTTIDISKISPARIVVFEGSGSRVAIFEGSGSRIARFE